MAETILKHALKTAGILIAFALAYTLLLAYTHDVTKAPIEKSEAEVRMALFSQILPDNMHNNAMLKDTISIAPNELLGNTQPMSQIALALIISLPRSFSKHWRMMVMQATSSC